MNNKESECACGRCPEIARDISKHLEEFLEKSFDEKFPRDKPENLRSLSGILLHTAALLAIECGTDLPDFVAEAAREWIQTQQELNVERFESMIEEGMKRLAQQGGKDPKDLN